MTNKKQKWLLRLIFVLFMLFMPLPAVCQFPENTPQSLQPAFRFEDFFQPMKKKAVPDHEREAERLGIKSTQIINWTFVWIIIAILMISCFIFAFKRSAAFRDLLKMIANVLFSKPSFRNYIYMCKRIVSFIHERLGHDSKAIKYKGNSDTEVL